MRCVPISPRLGPHGDMAMYDFVPVLSGEVSALSSGDPRDGRVYVSIPPALWLEKAKSPFLIFSSHKALGTLVTAGLMWSFWPWLTPRGGKGYVTPF